MIEGKQAVMFQKKREPGNEAANRNCTAPEKRLLISDLDDTLLGDTEALRRFQAFHAEVGDRLVLVYATGRFFESVVEDVRTTSLPEPLTVIGGVGSEIRSYPGGEQDPAWVARLSHQWSARRVRELLSAEPGLELQPESSQSGFKASFFLRDAPPEQRDHLKTELLKAGIRANIIYSSNRDLDILPAAADKGSAAAFLAQSLGFDRNRVIVAGNSGNDARLFEQAFYGIIVSNAHEELKRYADQDRVYLSPHARADGVRDGLRHWMRTQEESS